MLCRVLPVVVSLAAVLAAVRPAIAAPSYATADEAYSAGAKLYNEGKYAESRAPFEAALALAPDDRYRIKVYDALLAAYRLDPEIEPFVAACEFILDKSEQPAKRSISRRALLSFVNERGKADDLARRFEARLEKDAEDLIALYVLAELYARLKRDPQRAVELTERWAAAAEKAGQTLDVLEQANLAGLYAAAKRPKQAAELYEKIAPLDETLAAWHWKEAAAQWLAVGDQAKALAAATRSDESPPEARNDQLAHFWHRGLGDIYLVTGEAKRAIPHFEAAIEKTKIKGYIEDCRKSLAAAKEKAGVP
jgi:tetratricopeptide (TPR) repeat protein